jgi:hypothetical protein
MFCFPLTLESTDWFRSAGCNPTRHMYVCWQGSESAAKESKMGMRVLVQAILISSDDSVTSGVSPACV